MTLVSVMQSTKHARLLPVWYSDMQVLR